MCIAKASISGRGRVGRAGPAGAALQFGDDRGAAADGLAAVRALWHLHDLVREHHHQPGPHISERCAGRKLRGQPQLAQLSPGARPLSPLRAQRTMDHHQCALRHAHSIPSAQIAP